MISFCHMVQPYDHVPFGLAVWVFDMLMAVV